MKAALDKAKGRLGSTRSITMHRHAVPSMPKPICKDGVESANDLIGHLFTLVRSRDALSHLSRITLGCQRGKWEVDRPGTEEVAGPSPANSDRDTSVSVSLSWQEPSMSAASGRSDKSISDVESAISGILALVLKQCHQRHGLAESEDLYRVILHAISDVAILTNEGGEITYICPNADGFCGRSFEEIKRIPSIFDILGPDSGCFETMRTGEPLHDWKTKLVGTDGSEVTVLVDVVKTELRQGPYLFTMRDVSLLSESEEKLAEANSRLQASAQALAEKNIALRELLHQAGEEYLDIQSDLRASIDTTILPLVTALEKEGYPSQKAILDTLREALNALVSARASRPGPPTNLTSRELKICNMISSGFSTKQIASALNVAPATVANTRKRIRKKLGISGISQNLATHWRTMQS